MKELSKAVEYNVGPYQRTVEKALEELKGNRIISRIWAHDHTVWKPEPTEITNRLGWLHSPEAMNEDVARITAFVEGVREDGSHESSMSFGVFKAAQAIGDRQALIRRGRKLIRFHLDGNPVRGIRTLVEGLR